MKKNKGEEPQFTGKGLVVGTKTLSYVNFFENETLYTDTSILSFQHQYYSPPDVNHSHIATLIGGCVLWQFPIIVITF